jgi:hypothetical protein
MAVFEILIQIRIFGQLLVVEIITDAKQHLKGSNFSQKLRNCHCYGNSHLSRWRKF